MKSSTSYKITLLGAAVLLVAVAFAGWNWFASSSAPPADAPGPASGMVNSSTHVAASLATEGDTGIVTLHIDKGWHVNANPASLGNLIAATVWIERDGARHAAQATYPHGQSSGIVIDGTDILVYEDGATIAVANLSDPQTSRVLVHVQACNTKGLCLAPATITASADRT